MSSSRYVLYVLIFPNWKRYFGITANTAEARLKEHLKNAFKRKLMTPVYCAIRKYGAPRLQCLVIGDRRYIQDLEIAAISHFKTTDRRYGYNVTLGGDVSPMHSKEVADRVSASKRQRFMDDPEYADRLRAQARAMSAPEIRARTNAAIRTPEVSAKKSKKMTGRNLSAAHLAKMAEIQRDPEYRAKLSRSVREAWSDPVLRAEQSARFRGRPISPAQRRQISASLMGHPGYGKGLTRAPEFGAKISAAKMGHAVSLETREKIGRAHKGRKASAETRAKLSAALRGRKCPKSPETRAKIAASLTGRKQSPEMIAARVAGRRKYNQSGFSEKHRFNLKTAAIRARHGREFVPRYHPASDFGAGSLAGLCL